MRCRQPVQPRDKSAATQPICVQVKRGERMAKTQCVSGDRRDRTRLGLSEPPPRPLDVADPVHFVLIGCVPASNRRTRRHAGAGRTQAAASPTLRRTSCGRQRARRRELPRRRPLRLRRALASAALLAISTCKARGTSATRRRSLSPVGWLLSQRALRRLLATHGPTRRCARSGSRDRRSGGRRGADRVLPTQGVNRNPRAWASPSAHCGSAAFGLDGRA
jgi:hypothetical protein